MPTFELTNLDNSLLLRPDISASVVDLWLGGRPVLAPARFADEPNPTQTSLFTMLPWCKRLSSSGVRDSAGSLQPIKPNWPTTPYPVHGIGWLQPWQVDQRSPSRVHLALEHRDDGPYAFRAGYEIALAKDAVSFSIEIENTGEVELPFGIGFHPYFPRRSDTKVNIHGTSITTFNEEGLPASTVDAPEAGATRLGTSGFNHQVKGATNIQIEQPDEAVSLAIELSDSLSHAHLWAPAEESFFCIEPLSHAVDAFSHAEQAQDHMLAPGRSMEATMKLIYLD